MNSNLPVYGAAILLATLLWRPSVAAEDAVSPFQQQPNVVYAEEHGVGLVMDIFTPTGAKNGLAIVDVVSGGWNSSRGKMRDHQRAQLFDIFCQRGYTVFAVRPGSLSKFTISEMASHIEKAIVWVKQRAGQYNIAADRLGLIGASAGGHLASLVAVSNESSDARPGNDQASVKAVGVFFPPTDLLEYGGRKIEPSSKEGVSALVRRVAFPQGVGELTEQQIRDRLVEISPARRVTKDAPPFLLIHGTADALVPLEQSKKMQRALQEKDVAVQLIVKKGGGHPWPTIHEEVAVLADWFDRQLRNRFGKSTAASRIEIDGKFDDWANLPSYADSASDTHDTEHSQQLDRPKAVEHPDVDLLEFKVTHDTKNLYFFFRSHGQIGRTQTEIGGKQAGRYYAIVTIDVDDNDETGYWIHEGGYYPTSRGYDVNAEIEYYNGELNTACYLNHGARNAKELKQAFLDQSTGKHRTGHDGPYKAGFMRLLPGTYDHYTQWVYHKNNTITFVRDKGPVVPGVAKAAISADGHRLEAMFPLKGFLVDENGEPVIKLGDKIDLSFSLEASGELAPEGKWASDTGPPIDGYRLK